jgi:hypothetical protein
MVPARRICFSIMRESDTSGGRIEPGGPGASRRDGRGRIIGLLGVFFYGTWMVFFTVATLFMVAILAGGADDPTKTILLAALCAAITVFNAWRLRRPLRRLRESLRRPTS